MRASPPHQCRCLTAACSANSPLHCQLAPLAGLAIYNGHILEFQFPDTLYKKLLGQALGLEDLAELQPALARSLAQLLAMDEQQLAGLDLSFQVATRVCQCGMHGCRAVTTAHTHTCTHATTCPRPSASPCQIQLAALLP